MPVLIQCKPQIGNPKQPYGPIKTRCATLTHTLKPKIGHSNGTDRGRRERQSDRLENPFGHVTERLSGL